MAKCNANVTTVKGKAEPGRSWIGKRLLTYKEAAAEYGVTVWALRTLVWERRLAVVQFTPGKHLIDRADLDRLIEGSKGFIS